MLTELRIENLGVIERLDLVLGEGLTAFTGETGAGKTMLVEAIELLVGVRADASSVRHGTPEARVEGRFVRADGTETVIARVVPADGRSRAYVDGRLATVASLAEVVADSVDLHGQHAHQRLLSAATQRAALDTYGGIDLEPLRRARARSTEIDAGLAALGGDERARAREIDLLRFQTAELDAAGLGDPAEDERLDAEESLLADATDHRASGTAALAGLSADGGARDALAGVLARLDGAAPFADAAERLRDLLAELDDLTAELRSTAEAIEEDPERLAQVRDRRQLLSDLRRKYGDDLAAVMEFYSEAAQRLGELERHDERAAELERQRERALAAEREAAAVLGRARRRSAPQLAADVQARLRSLAMPHAEVAIEVGEHADDHPGDRVRFLLAANPGSPLLPLTRVASGGELARVMLALRLALAGAGGLPGPSAGAAGHDAVPDTLVFDEVDAGIGGDAAQSVGSALASLGRHHQVLVVTHLAQVAAVSDQQVLVDKTVVDGVTTATARRLDGEDRVDEIARMLSGVRSAAAREHARDLLAGA